MNSAAKARRQLQPGTIIYLEVVFPEGPRPKYLVVAHVNEECCTFVVNSRIHPFIETHPSLAVCQVRSMPPVMEQTQIADSLSAPYDDGD